MPRKTPNLDFRIHVDPSCLSEPMDEEVQSPIVEVPNDDGTPSQELASDDVASLSEADNNVSVGDISETSVDPEPKHDESEIEARQPAKPSVQESEELDIQLSIEVDDMESVAEPVDRANSSSQASSRRASKRTEELIQQAARDIVARIEHNKGEDNEETGEHSIISERSHPSVHEDEAEGSYMENSMLESEAGFSEAPHRLDDGAESSSHHEGTDDDVFSNKSPRSSMGSYDGGSEGGKARDMDNMTTITHSSRISDISQYEKEDFIPTARGTPRPPFRTPSDVRALQMSSPAASVIGSPRSTRKHFPTVSRLGTPSASAQYSPKRRSTPTRFKSHQEAPLVLLHVTLLPLRWMWGDIVNNLDPAEMSEQGKTLRDSWRMLQDRVGDTVIERGILLGHPQNDYEVLEERLLEALDLPVRRRARILECGHYLGPSNENTIMEEDESEDEQGERRRESGPKRHWCRTCKNEIRFDALGDSKIFRVKVYASNGLMRAGAWEACWKEMERVDVELEPLVEPAVQDEIVRLAAEQQQREVAQQEEAEIQKEVAQQYEEQRRSEERLLLQVQAELSPRSPTPAPHIVEPEPMPEPVYEPVHEPARESCSSRRRQRDEDRLREIYGQTPPPPESRSQTTEPASHRHPDSYIPPPSPRSPSEEAQERRESRRRSYQSASLPELLLQSVRVLMQDSKNVAILGLSVIVLFFALRNAPTTEPQFVEPVINGIKTSAPEVQVRQASVNEAPQAQAIHQEARNLHTQNVAPIAVATPSVAPPVVNAVVEPEQPSTTPAQDTVVSVAATSVSTVYEPCETSTVSSVVSEVQPPQETETVTQRKVVKVVQTVTETQTQTEFETATAVETVKAKATGIAEPLASVDMHEESVEMNEKELAESPVEEPLLAVEPEQVEIGVEVKQDGLLA
ncbi:hypothetical protein F5Y16DRAFT_383635 [Xylariaceae sp. FL0255]|nr:hypothetical protein F5Y16DRAFT_383635 [Xylariaceae sp. FL0255]